MTSQDDVGVETYETFFATCDQFKLGTLVTESPNPITTGLAESAKSNLPNAMQMLQLADVNALAKLGTNKVAMKQLKELAKDIHQVLEAGHCVFFEGCGATGRLSLTIEVLVREGLIEDKYRDQVKGFMAGGDAALIRSIEQFEDRRDFGARQLSDLGFVDGDLCVAITEGGETTFVIAAVEEAVALGPSRRHWFIYCNPDDVLCPVAERSKNVIENAKIEKMNITCGPMAVTGSTRMQATTVQLLAAGLAVQHHANPDCIEEELRNFARFHATLDYASFAKCTAAEAALYRENIPFVYRTEYFTCTVLTDTTERSPTFSLPPFESFAAERKGVDAPTPAYLHLPGTRSAHDAWQRLLRREPRGIQWDECWKKTGNRAIYGYDFSDQVISRRACLLSPQVSERTGGGKSLFVTFELDLTRAFIPEPSREQQEKSAERHRAELEGVDDEFGAAAQEGEDEGEEGNDGHPYACIRFAVPKVADLLDEKKTASTHPELACERSQIEVPVSWVKPMTKFKSNLQDASYTRYAEPLLLNVLAKMVLNAHSTALMGLNGRLRSNVMTYVRPSNKKLIDRAARYVSQLFDEAQTNVVPNERERLEYEEVVRCIFDERVKLGPSDPIVVRVFDLMMKKHGSKIQNSVIPGEEDCSRGGGGEPSSNQLLKKKR